MFNTENRVYRVVIKDNNGDIIPAQIITTMEVIIYHDQIMRKALKYQTLPLDGDADGEITEETDHHKFVITSTQTKDLKPGKYIIQIKYEVDDPAIPPEDRISISDREIFIIKPYIK